MLEECLVSATFKNGLDKGNRDDARAKYRKWKETCLESAEDLFLLRYACECALVNIWPQPSFLCHSCYTVLFILVLLEHEIFEPFRGSGALRVDVCGP